MNLFEKTPGWLAGKKGQRIISKSNPDCKTVYTADRVGPRTNARVCHACKGFFRLNGRYKGQAKGISRVFFWRDAATGAGEERAGWQDQ
jgi:hypothetical protein